MVGFHLAIAKQQNQRGKGMALLRTTKAVATDMHFIIPLIVLIIGTALLVGLH
jgi:hypothetical protein